MIAPGAGAVFSAANTILSFGQSAFAGVGAGKVVDGAYIAANETGLNVWGRAEFGYSTLSHEYTFTESMGRGFSPDQMADAAQRYAFPGQDPSTYATNGGTGWVYEPMTGLPAGQIDTFVRNGGLTTINKTLPWHVLHDGVVIRSTWMSPTGNWFTSTFGFGLNARFTYPEWLTGGLRDLGGGWGADIFEAMNGLSIDLVGGANDWYGEILFRDMNTAMRSYLQ